MAKIIWKKSALKDVEAIGDYIAESNPKRAVQFSNELIKSVDRLAKFPFSGSLCPEYPGLRQVVHKGYRIIYFIRDEVEVEIITIINKELLRNKIINKS